jgi:hypothetical protein
MKDATALQSLEKPSVTGPPPVDLVFSEGGRHR